MASVGLAKIKKDPYLLFFFLLHVWRSQEGRKEANITETRGETTPSPHPLIPCN